MYMQTDRHTNRMHKHHTTLLENIDNVKKMHNSTKNTLPVICSRRLYVSTIFFEILNMKS